jgi:uncharacterized protein
MIFTILTKGRTILVVGTLFCSTSHPATLQAEPTANSQEVQAKRNKQMVTAAFDRWADGNSDFFNEMLAPDIEWTVEGSGPSAATYRGLEAFMSGAVRPFVSRLRIPVRPLSKRLWADGDHVIINWEGEAIAQDGRPYRNRYVWIFRMAGGKAAEVNAFLDLAPYDDVLRRIPAPGEEGAQ